MQRVVFSKSHLILFFVFVFCLSQISPAQSKSLRRFPCDPKFGYEGNYIEITTSDIATAQKVSVCFSKTIDPPVTRAIRWWEFWKKEPKEDATVSAGEEACLSTIDLPGRFRVQDGRWSDWQRAVSLEKKNTTFQFALCGDKKDISLWERFHQHNGTDSWDGLHLKSSGEGSIFLERIRIVQNRVRILDDESADEGYVQFLLQSGKNARGELDLSTRIKQSKLNRLNCLNLESGPPYCEKAVSGLQRKENVPQTIKTALLELGHSGSVKYGRKNNSYCSEFAYYVIEKSVRLSDTCKRFIPDPSRENVNVKDMYRWFKGCNRLIGRDKIREHISPGDFLSVDNHKHSVIFLGWTDSTKTFFWEISGNNKCKPERETFYAPKNKSNMVCISKRNFDQDVTKQDFGGVVH